MREGEREREEGEREGNMLDGLLCPGLLQSVGVSGFHQ